MALSRHYHSDAAAMCFPAFPTVAHEEVCLVQAIHPKAQMRVRSCTVESAEWPLKSQWSIEGHPGQHSPPRTYAMLNSLLTNTKAFVPKGKADIFSLASTLLVHTGDGEEWNLHGSIEFTASLVSCSRQSGVSPARCLLLVAAWCFGIFDAKLRTVLCITPLQCLLCIDYWPATHLCISLILSSSSNCLN